MADASTTTGFNPPQEPQAQIQVFNPRWPKKIYQQADPSDVRSGDAATPFPAGVLNEYQSLRAMLESTDPDCGSTRGTSSKVGVLSARNAEGSRPRRVDCTTADIGAILAEMGQYAASATYYRRPILIPPSDPVLSLHFGLIKDWDTQLLDLPLGAFHLCERILDGDLAFHHLLEICPTEGTQIFRTSVSRIFFGTSIEIWTVPAQARKFSSVTQSPFTNTNMATFMRTSTSGVSSLLCGLITLSFAVEKPSSLAERCICRTARDL
ncbi:hypothetical protein LTR86_005908 [Recurvomyces mirabilis]|nr:hypothetical protein LTR86_005908 [Recurvomyces mirabilis]